MSIYHQNGVNFCTPYFYIIEHVTSKTSKRYYAGYKEADPDSRNLMQPGGYHTSSKKDIILIIKTEGLAAFAVRKIRHFATSEEAKAYETRFLKRVRVPKNPEWYNRHPGGIRFRCDCTGRKLSTEHVEKMRAAFVGRKLSEEVKIRMRVPKHAGFGSIISKVQLGRRNSAESNAKRSTTMSGKPKSAEWKAKIKASWVLRKLKP